MGWYYTRFLNFVGEGDVIKISGESARFVKKFYREHKHALKYFQLFVDEEVGDHATAHDLNFVFKTAYFVRFHNLHSAGSWCKLMTSDTLAPSTFIKMTDAQIENIDNMKVSTGKISMTVLSYSLKDPEDLRDEDDDEDDEDDEDDDSDSKKYVKLNMKLTDKDDDDGIYP